MARLTAHQALDRLMDGGRHRVKGSAPALVGLQLIGEAHGKGLCAIGEEDIFIFRSGDGGIIAPWPSRRPFSKAAQPPSPT